MRQWNKISSMLRQHEPVTGKVLTKMTLPSEHRGEKVINVSDKLEPHGHKNHLVSGGVNGACVR